MSPASELAGLSGRRRQAARNDELILGAARAVFLTDPRAPVADVAKRAGVGISALYRRFESKEDLLRTLCHEGLRRYLAEARAAEAEPDPWCALLGFLDAIVAADVHSLSVHLAGTFTPTEQMAIDARQAGELTAAIVGRAAQAGLLRPGIVVADLTLILEACTAIRVSDAERARQLRRRLLAMLVTSLKAKPSAESELPGPPPESGELTRHWEPR